MFQFHKNSHNLTHSAGARRAQHVNKSSLKSSREESDLNAHVNITILLSDLCYKL
jgi:hypothetical protein